MPPERPYDAATGGLTKTIDESLIDLAFALLLTMPIQKKIFDRTELVEEILYNLSMPEPILYELDLNVGDDQLSDTERSIRMSGLDREISGFHKLLLM